MSHVIPTHPSPETAAGANGHKLPSLDFRGTRELDWSEIEEALNKLSAHAMAVEMVGRGSQDNVHGDRLDGVFDFLSEEIVGQIKQLTALLGLKHEGTRS